MAADQTARHDQNPIKRNGPAPAVKDVPEKDRSVQVPPARKRLLDTVRMSAYRAETALWSVLGAQKVKSAEARRHPARPLLHRSGHRPG